MYTIEVVEHPGSRFEAQAILEGKAVNWFGGTPEEAVGGLVQMCAPRFGVRVRGVSQEDSSLQLLILGVLVRDCEESPEGSLWPYTGLTPDGIAGQLRLRNSHPTLTVNRLLHDLEEKGLVECSCVGPTGRLWWPKFDAQTLLTKLSSE